MRQKQLIAGTAIAATLVVGVYGAGIVDLPRSTASDGATGVAAVAPASQVPRAAPPTAPSAATPFTTPSAAPAPSAATSAPAASGGPTARPSARAGAAPAAVAPVWKSRDKHVQPFASTSIWNKPIGSAARYVPAGIPGGISGVPVDVDWYVRVKASDPAVPTYMAATFTQGRCAGTTPQQQGQWHPELLQPIKVPRNLVIPDATAVPYSTPNASSAFLMPDGRTLEQFNVTARCKPGGPLYGFRVKRQSIYGDGINGGHLGSGLSSIGGTLRKGEILGSTPIRHALKIDIWGKYLAYNNDGTRGFRWPASLADGAAPTAYQGKNPALEMGALVAIKPGTTARQLGITSPEGRKLFAALQDYGAYIVDDSGWDAVNLCAEEGVQEEYKKKTGRAWGSGAFGRDYRRLVEALNVVDNNGPKSVGGGGTLRRPLAPPIGN